MEARSIDTDAGVAHAPDQIAVDRIESVFFDVDGTLVDSNDAHAQAWIDAFAEFDVTIVFDTIRPLIGMGSDKLFDALDISLRAADSVGKAIAQRRKAIFLERYLPSLKPFAGARELVSACRSAGLRCLVASSASPEELEPLLAIADVSNLFEHAVGPEEIDATKPDPDVVLAALAWSHTEARRAVMIGDTSYDIDAAHRAGVRCIALRCGGSPGRALRSADAEYADPRELAVALRGGTIDTLLPPSGARVPS